MAGRRDFKAEMQAITESREAQEERLAREQRMVAAAQPQQQPTERDFRAEMSARGAGDSVDATPKMDWVRGAAQGNLDLTQENLSDLAGDPRGPAAGLGELEEGDYLGAASHLISQVPGAALNLMTGGTGGDALRRLDLGKHGPLPEGPGNIEEQFGYESAAATQVGGAMAAGGARALQQWLKGKYGVDVPTKELAERMAQKDLPREQYADDIAGVSPVDKAQVDAAYDAAGRAPGADAPMMAPIPKPTPKHTDINQPPPTAPTAATGVGSPQAEYRARIQTLLTERGRWVRKEDQKLLMAADGMTLREYIRLKKSISIETKKPKNDLVPDPPKAVNRRGAYTEAKAALENMKMPADNVAAEMYGEAAKLHTIRRNYERARQTVLKHVEGAGPDGKRHFQSRAFQNEMDKMRPEDRKAMFGVKLNRVINAAKRVTGRGFKFHAKAKYKADVAIVRLLTGWGLLAGVATGSKTAVRTAMHRGRRKAKTELLGPSATRGRGADR